MTQTIPGSAAQNGVADPPAAAETISGGHLVAKALKNEGVDVIFTLCGGHIIDIYDGCVDEGIDVIDVRHEQVAAHAADGYARITGTPGCAVVTAGPGTTDAVTGVANALRAESPMLLIGGQGALTQHKMGSLQDLPHVDMMAPITKFAATVPHTARVADMVSMAFRECLTARPGRRSSRSPATSSTPRCRVDRPGSPEPGRYRASTRSAGDPGAIQRLADLLVASEKPCVLLGSQVWTCRAADAAHRVRPHAEHPGLHERRRPRHARRPATRTTSSSPAACLQRGRPDHHRRHAVRLPHGLRQAACAHATVVQIDLDYRTVGKNRDIDLGIVGDVGAVLQSVTAAPSGRIDKAPPTARPGSTSCGRPRRSRLREAAAAPALRRHADRPLPARARDQRVPHRGHHLHRRRRRHRHLLRPGRAAQVARPLDGPRPAGHARRRRAVRDGRQVRPPGQGDPRALRRRRLLLTGWDFETLVRFNLPFVGIVGNNSSMNQIRYGQIQKYGEDARPRRQHARRRAVRPVREDARRIRRGSARPGRHRARARARPRESGPPSLINVWVDPEVYAPGTMNQTMYK